MELIIKLGVRLNKKGYSQSWGLFLCPFCLSEIEKTLSHGYRDKSCGCRKGSITHGETRTRLYKVWTGMKQRVLNPNSPYYQYYGGRGITICPEWAESYIKFRDWSLSNGYTNNLEIDRINNNGNYEPNNCQWITHTENMRKTNKCKVTMGIANEIRELDKTGIYMQKELAKKYDIDNSHINNIIKNRKWKT